MLKTLIFIFSVIAATQISGFSLTTLTSASLAICVVLWINELVTISTGTGYVINDPECYNPILLTQALEKALSNSLQSKKRLILQISNPGVNTIKVHINQSGELHVSDSRRSIKVENRALAWIPNHPLPLELLAGGYSTLMFTPLSDGRASVTAANPYLKIAYPTLTALALTLFFIFDLTALAAALLAIIFYDILKRRFAES